MTHFDDLDRALHSDEINASLMKFIADIIQRVYVVLGDGEVNGEAMMDKYARTLIVSWACRAGNEDCLRTIGMMFTRMLEGEDEVDVNLQSAVYCAALRSSSNEQFQRFMSKLAASDDQDEQGRMIDAAGCAADENKLMALLVSSLEQSEFVYREAEKPRVVLSVLRGSKMGASAVIKFYQQYYEEFLEK